MARVTVEDCLEKVDNRFELVMMASKRARDLSLHGADSELDWGNDKPTVVALREIADGLVDKSIFTEKAAKAQEVQEEATSVDAKPSDDAGQEEVVV